MSSLFRTGCLCCLLFVGLSTSQAWGSFHLMQIEQVIGGVNGDATAQAIQLRMRAAGQNLLSPARIRVFDAAGANPVTIYDFSGGNFTVGSGAGRRILLVSPNFPMHTTPAAVDDVSGMVNLIPASYLAAGSLTFETDAGTSIYWRLSWGGAAYTGSCTGVSVGGNDADGNFCPPFPGPLPSNGARAILFDGAAGDPSTNNAADYILTPGSAVFINNAAVPGMFTVNPCIGDGDCNDGVACTDGTCSGGSCTFTPNNANCPSDGQFCNGPEVCNAVSGCVSSGNPCMPPTPFCDEDTDTCGTCNMDPQCDDGIACTMDACVGGFCNHTPDHASCNNGQFCDGVEVCNPMMGGCQSPGTPCDAGEVCNEATDMCEAGAIRIKLVPVGGTGRGTGDLISPVSLTHANDGSHRLFVVDQAGYIRVIEDDAVLPTPFLDLTAKIPTLNPDFDERGVLGLAFHPDYVNNGRFFVRYSAPRTGMPGEPCLTDPFITGCHAEVLAEYQVSMADPNVADPSSEIILFSADKPEWNHNAGHVAFGPGDYLFWSLGDGGGANDGLPGGVHGPEGNGQNINTPLGKVLRIDVDAGAPYAIPPTNPFAGATPGLDEIYAYGLRNPYRFSFDRANGMLYLGDAGQDLFEEIDIIALGGNYGWVIREGFHCFDPANPGTPLASCPMTGAMGEPLLNPVNEYLHPLSCTMDADCADYGVGCDETASLCENEGGLAVVGGYVYRGTEFPALDGHYVFGDFSADFGATGRLYYFETTGPNAFERVQFIIGADDASFGKVLKGFGEDEDGEIFVLASDNLGPMRGTPTGAVYRIEECFVVVFGDIAPAFGEVDVADVLRVLDGFADNQAFPEADIVPCGGDGFIDVGDVLGVLDAFAGIETCPPNCL